VGVTAADSAVPDGSASDGTAPVMAVIGEVVADAVVARRTEYDASRAASAAETLSPGSLSAERLSPGTQSPETLSLTVHPGGGPANAAVALARLGSMARFAGRLSTGTLGRLCRARLEASGVDLAASLDVPQPATLAIATLEHGGAARYEFYTDGTADWGWRDAELDRLLDRALGPTPVAVHVGSLALVLQPSGAAIESFLGRARATCTVSIDPNVRAGLVPLATYRRAIDRWASLADIVKLSDDDLAELWPDLDIDGAAAHLHDRGVGLVVITRGAAGAAVSLRCASGPCRFEVPAVATTVVDTVGAGDSFAAGLLHRLGARGALGGRLSDLGPETARDAVIFAAHVAAITCSRPGADSPWADELPDDLRRDALDATALR